MVHIMSKLVKASYFCAFLAVFTATFYVVYSEQIIVSGIKEKLNEQFSG